MHNFFVPLRSTPERELRSSRRILEQSTTKTSHSQERAGIVKRNRVFGMTARILVDTARVAYAEVPEIEHDHKVGDEDVIAVLKDTTRQLDDKTRRGPLKKRAKLS